MYLSFYIDVQHSYVNNKKINKGNPFIGVETKIIAFQENAIESQINTITPL